MKYFHNKSIATASAPWLAIFTVVLFSLAFSSCETRVYEHCPADRVFGYWGVMDDSKTFGIHDSLYYVMNPIGNVGDSVYYNGNYTSSNYLSDPVRVTLCYTDDDSIYFNLERLYITEENPLSILMTITAERGPEEYETCQLTVNRTTNNESLYRSGPDHTFRRLLESGLELKVNATNVGNGPESSGSQNYVFSIYSAGFDKAFQLADSLNHR